MFSDFKNNVHDVALLKFKCPNENCGKSYKYKPDLNRHIKSYCGKEPNYVCQYCYKRFMRKDVWKNHLAFVHKSFVI
ncbi:sex determination protein fruitless-like isoform X34 [Aphis craccivora]|uniref:Sex determination protein fruitless-like isoform X34 n=1 Tax=Aphis craccivora TaxID=307492 RepID=A0A6G0YGG3_APHCR|nr:sex determination protein fruitless-like isoform X34 [Aphis craccivora]